MLGVENKMWYNYFKVIRRILRRDDIMDKKRAYIAYIKKNLDDRNYKYVSHMKYHKLLFFSLAYSLAYYNDKNCFQDLDFEAWENGPVEAKIRQDILYENYGIISKYVSNADLSILTKEEKESISRVVKLMSMCSAAGLSQLTHDDIFIRKDLSATPWEKAHGGCGYSRTSIKRSYIKEFYTQEWFKSFEKYHSEILEKMNGN